jgi:hypothetical protein
LKKHIYILLLLGIFISTDFFAQVGGRRKEHKNQSKRAFSLFKGKHRAGNAHIFARGGRHSKTKSGSKWTMKHSNTAKISFRGQKYLFSRFRTKSKANNHAFLARQNKQRAKKRVIGNKVFHRKKYF